MHPVSVLRTRRGQQGAVLWGIPYQACHRAEDGTCQDRGQGKSLDEAGAEPRQRPRARGETGSRWHQANQRPNQEGVRGAGLGNKPHQKVGQMRAACWADDGPVQTTADRAIGRQAVARWPSRSPSVVQTNSVSITWVPVRNASFSPHPRATQ